MTSRTLFSTDGTVNKQTSNEENLLNEKKHLMKEIETLENKINQVKEDADTSRISDIINTLLVDDLNVSSLENVPNLNEQLQYELYKYAGLYCTKLEGNELIFNFNSSRKSNVENSFAVQIFINNNKVKVGRWIMPMSVDVDKLLSERPITSLHNIRLFLKDCRYLLDCHFVRLEQLEALKDKTMDIQNCKVNSNLCYTEIIIEFFNVYDKKNDEWIDVTLYLCYNPNRVRPNLINLEVSSPEKHQAQQIDLLKSYVKLFKKVELHLAFEQFLQEEDASFRWNKKEESDLELHSANSSSEEAFQTLVKGKNKRTLKDKRKRGTSQKKLKKSKQNDTLDSIKQQENDKDIIRKKKTHKSHLKKTRNKKESEVNKSMSALENSNDNFIDAQDETPLNVRKERWKQTKLNFKDKQKPQLTSSTPLLKRPTSSTSSNNFLNKFNLELSDILAPKNISDVKQQN